MLPTEMIQSSVFLAELNCRSVHTPGICNMMISITLEVLFDQWHLTGHDDALDFVQSKVGCDGYMNPAVLSVSK